MSLLQTALNIFNNTEDFVETKNYYFENHVCEKTGNTIKVKLDFSLLDEITKEFIRFNQCPECKKTFYSKGIKK